LYAGLEIQSGVAIVIVKILFIQWTIHIHLNAVEKINRLAERVETATHEIMHAHAEILFDGLFDQIRPFAGVMIIIAVKISGVDALFADAGNIDIQIARDGQQADCFFLLIDG
jgi:hypothetical protein